MKSVLIVSGGGFQGQGLLEVLRELPGVRPIVADMHDDSVTRYLCPDYRVLPPLAERDAHVAALLRTIDDEGVCAVLPATAYELPLLAELSGPLSARGIATAVCASGLLAALLDKRATAAFLGRHGLPHQAEVDPIRHEFGPPLFGRPAQGWGGRGTQLLRTAAERDRAAAAGLLADCTWSAYVDHFEEFSADLAITPDGRLSPIVLRRRLRTSGGFAVISESVVDLALEALVQQVAAALAQDGGAGFFNIQVIRPTPAGEPFVSDINPRFGTSSGHALGEGVNLAAFFLGLPTGGARRRVKTVRHLQDITVPRLPSRPRAVVFDLDDTLVDHKHWFARKAIAAGDAVAGQWADRDDFLETVLGLVDEGERRHFVDQLCARLGWSAQQHATYLEAFRAARVETPLYPDVEPCLAAIRAMGFATALLTDNPPATQRQKISGAAPVFAQFDAIVFSQEVGAEKPNAHAFQAVGEALGVPVPQLCMVGDNLFRDAVGALRAGYGSAILLRRAGGFVHAHDGLRNFSRFADDLRIARAPDLVITREILSGS